MLLNYFVTCNSIYKNFGLIKTLKGGSNLMGNAAIVTKKRVVFQVNAEPGSKVYVAGDFNNWEPKKQLKDKNNDGVFKGTILLDREQQYEYKFIINGKWIVDPNCDEWVPNTMGSLNSVVQT